jgi:hypothetical protein
MTYDDPCAQCGQVHPGCRGHKKNEPDKGKPCRRPCLKGEVCRAHGGGAPQVKAARARRDVEREAARQVATLGLPIDVSPTEALLQEVQWTAGHVHWLRQKVAELEEQVTGFTAPEGQEDEAEFFSHHPNHSRHGLVWGTTRITDKRSGAEPGIDTVESSGPSVWYELYTRERAHLVMVCSAALKAGVEERRVRLAESQGDLVATAIRRILDALGLTEAQQALVGTVVPRELRLIAGGAA